MASSSAAAFQGCVSIVAIQDVGGKKVSGNIYDIAFKKTADLKKIGMKICSNSKDMIISSISDDGLVPQWISANPGASIKPLAGDVVIEVNGIKGIDAMRQEMLTQGSKVVDGWAGAYGLDIEWLEMFAQGDAFKLTVFRAPSRPEEELSEWDFSREKPFPFEMLDFTDAPACKLHQGTISFDDGKGDGYKVQYGGRNPEQEGKYLRDNEAKFYEEYVAKEFTAKNKKVEGDYPHPMTEKEITETIAGIRQGDVKLYDPITGKMQSGLSKGFNGRSNFAIVSIPGANQELYNDVLYACLEYGVPFAVVWETNWQLLWYRVWKKAVSLARDGGRHVIVLTKNNGEVGFNQSIEICYLKNEVPEDKLHFLPAATLMRQMKPMVTAAKETDEKVLHTIFRDHRGTALRRLLQQEDSSGESCVILFTKHNRRFEWLQKALRANADPRSQNFFGMTPLFVAAHFNTVDSMHALIEAHADINLAENDGQTPTSKAAEKGNTECLQKLLQAGADCNIADSDGCSPTFMAAQEGQVGCLQELLKARADCNIAKNTGATPTFKASQNGHDGCLQELLKARADCNLVNNEGVSPIFMASQKGQVGCVQELLKARADCNIARNDGCSPTFMASFNGHVGCLQELLRARADYQQKWKGKTPLQMAMQQQHAQCVKLLQDAERQAHMRKELEKSTLRQLKQIAVQKGIAPNVIEAVDDTEDPKQSVIDIILQSEAEGDRR